MSRHSSIEESSKVRRAPIDLSVEHQPESCLLVGFHWRRHHPRGAETGKSAEPYSAEESLQELAELAAGAGAKVFGSLVQSRDRADPATLVGPGKVTEIRARAAELDADLILFDVNLTPTQQRNLEDQIGRKVIDRTQLILDIFAAHARTREGQLQVELAQLNYLLPRLAGHGVALSRLGGGIGTRGPGETKLETDRRRIARRIEKLKRDLEAVRATRGRQRKKRSTIPLSTVALVGYTNAGKSTLFNALTHADVVADARMFATLDPTIRAFLLPSKRRVLFSDTVGFIRSLPTGLIQAFRATLEEVSEAAMILHVVDVSSVHFRSQRQEVDKVLRELKAHTKPRILVLNKSDRLKAGEVATAIEGETGLHAATTVVAISARTGAGLPELVQAIERLLPDEPLSECRYHFAHEEGDRLALLYEHAQVLERSDTASGVMVRACVPASLRRQLRDFEAGEKAGRALNEAARST